jgi:hypothetical protein
MVRKYALMCENGVRKNSWLSLIMSVKTSFLSVHSVGKCVMRWGVDSILNAQEYSESWGVFFHLCGTHKKNISHLSELNFSAKFSHAWH